MLTSGKSLLLIILLLPLGTAYAGISLSKTRVIFKQGERAEEIMLRNTGKERYVVQASVAALSENKPVGDFYITPPLLVLEADSRAVLRIIARKNNLPSDRETAFWLKTNFIPAAQKPSADGKNEQHLAPKLAFSLGMAVKLFYRPANLPLTPDEAFAKVRIAAVAGGISVDNPTPYYITFSDLKIDGSALHFANQAAMLSPFSHTVYPSARSGRHLTWSFINDYGGVDNKIYQSDQR